MCHDALLPQHLLAKENKDTLDLVPESFAVPISKPDQGIFEFRKLYISDIH